MIQQQTSIKVVIFDLGNVIARVDLHKPFGGIGCFLNEPVSPQMQAELAPQVERYERGEVEDGAFLLFLQALIQRQNTLLPAGTPDTLTLRDIWNSMITELPLRNLQVIQNVRKKYKTCLLSNTNHLHMQYVNALQCGLDAGFSSLFDKMYLSYQLKLSKPNPEIYRFVLRDLGVPAQQCLFIDDRAENLQSARQEGMRTCLLENFNLPELFTSEGEPTALLQKMMA